jgi:CheY-like chemotaxis protein
MAKRRKEAGILIVDDEESIGLALSEMLKDEGFEAAYVVDGAQAVEEVTNNGYRLVFMDMVMPGMNGLETYRAIRKVSRSAKVIIFTGYIKDTDNIISQGVREGMIDEKIRKPYLADEIIRSVRKHLS